MFCSGQSHLLVDQFDKKRMTTGMDPDETLGLCSLGGGSREETAHRRAKSDAMKFN